MQTEAQAARVRRLERLIALAAPLLDLMLAAGDRFSRAIGPEDEYYPIRPGAETVELPGPARSDPDA